MNEREMRISILPLNRAEDDVMELLWQNGQVVLHNQNQRSLKKSQPALPAGQSAPREIPSSHHHHHHHQQQQHQQDHLFMQEDEMASWLHYPLNDTNFDSDFCTDLLFPPPCITSTTTTTATATPPPRATQVTDSRPQLNTAATVATAFALRPPIPPRTTENFGAFARHMPRAEASGPSNSKSVAIRESTVVDSSDTPAPGPHSRVSEAMRSMEGASGVNNNNRWCGHTSGAGATATSSGGAGGGGGSSGARDLATCEMTVTSSPGGSSASAEPPAQKPAAEDLKRKGRENDDEYHSEVKSAYHYFFFCFLFFYFTASQFFQFVFGYRARECDVNEHVCSLFLSPLGIP